MAEAENLPPEHLKESNEDFDAYSMGSLSEYISKHLQKRGQEQSGSSDSQKPKKKVVKLVPNETYPLSNQPPTNVRGLVLHHLDTQLADGCMERYLPLASTRYHLTRERVYKELQVLYEDLNRFRQFPGLEYYAKIEALERRVAFLQRRIVELDKEIVKLNPFSGLYNGLIQLSFNSSNLFASASKGWQFISNHKKPLKMEVSEANQELKSIHQMLKEQFLDPSFSPQQLGLLISQYDAQLAKAERLSEKLKQEKGLGERLKANIKAWMVSFASKPPEEMELNPHQ
jgi:hypothetical protein